MLAQEVDISGGFIVAYLVVVGLLALIPASIAKGKGRSFGAWWVFGVLLWLIAMIASLVISSRPAAQPGYQAGYAPPQTPWAPAPAAPAPSQAGFGGMTRECPWCKSAIRPDASVCVHCDRPSPAWTYSGGYWWTTDGSGQQVWLDTRYQPPVWKRAGQP